MERNYSITERQCLALVWADVQFRPYLYGRSFSVVTDHHALCWLSSLKDPTGRLGRWALRLQEYSYSVVHKSGRLHSDADCLSRYPVDKPDKADTDPSACVLSVSQLMDMANEQRYDASLRTLIDKLVRTPTDPSLRRFALRDGISYRPNFHLDGSSLLCLGAKHLFLGAMSVVLWRPHLSSSSPSPRQLCDNGLLTPSSSPRQLRGSACMRASPSALLSTPALYSNARTRRCLSCFFG